MTFPLSVEMETSVFVWLIPLFLAAPLVYSWSQRRSQLAARGGSRRTLAIVK